MNRRDFTKSLAAATTLPAFPIRASASAAGHASMGSLRFLAVYLSGLQGKFTPEMVSQMTGLKRHAAQNVVNQLVTEKLITPAHAAGKVALGSAFPLPKPRTLAPLPETPDSKSTDRLERLIKTIEDLDTGQEKTQDSDPEDTSDEQT